MKLGESENQDRGNFKCDRCGRPAAIAVDGVKVCVECYEVAGSCCLEFGGDDLWEEVLNEAESAEKDFESEKMRRMAS